MWLTTTQPVPKPSSQHHTSFCPFNETRPIKCFNLWLAGFARNRRQTATYVCSADATLVLLCRPPRDYLNRYHGPGVEGGRSPTWYNSNRKMIFAVLFLHLRTLLVPQRTTTTPSPYINIRFCSGEYLAHGRKSSCLHIERWPNELAINNTLSSSSQFTTERKYFDPRLSASLLFGSRSMNPQVCHHWGRPLQHCGDSGKLPISRIYPGGSEGHTEKGPHKAGKCEALRRINHQMHNGGVTIDRMCYQTTRHPCVQVQQWINHNNTTQLPVSCGFPLKSNNN